MDPRHPEMTIPRMRELMAQYTSILEQIKVANVSSKLGQLEREGGLVVQEICLVAPRLHEAMMQASRTRRAAIAHGLVSTEHFIREATPEEAAALDKAIEEIEAKEEKPKKKRKSTKKKKAEE